MDVGTSLDSCTTKANCAILDSGELRSILGNEPGYRLVLVDTPGFDSGYKSDSEGVLNEILIWSKAWYVHLSLFPLPSAYSSAECL